MSQAKLFIDTQDRIWEVMEKARSSGVFASEELALLETAIQSPAPQPRRFRNWQQVVNCWFAEYERACNGRAPKPTNMEWHSLMVAAGRLGGAEPTCALIPWFWKWRAQLPEKLMQPQPTPLGFAKHLASIQEYAAAQQAKAAVKNMPKLLREEQELAARYAPSPEEVRQFIAKVKGGVK